MNQFKKLLPGILIGIVIGVAGVVVWNYAGDMAAEKRAEAFAEGYSKAKDKSAFIKNFDFGGGSAISLSNSSADEGDARCPALNSNVRGLAYMIGQYGYSYNRILLEYDGYTDTVRDMEKELKEIYDEAMSLGCDPWGHGDDN